MIAEGDGSMMPTTTGQSELSSDSISLDAVSQLPTEAQSDLSPCSVNIQKDVAAIVEDIVLSVGDTDSNTCAGTMLASVESSSFDHQSTHLPACSTTVSASDDITDDVQLVEMQRNGNCCKCYV